MIDQYRRKFAENKQLFFDQWSEFLRFKSISADSAFAVDCEACCDWLARHVSALGFSVEILRGTGKPILFAQRAGDQSKRRVLFYGHYDVQPVDPVELWQTPPFQPEVRAGRMYGRGAQDNKGQLFYVLKAIETLVKENTLECPINLLIEGEEEVGSKMIAELLPKLKNSLKADVLMVCDTGTLDPSLATITMGLRGIVSCEIKLSGPKYDLHSGVHGGLIRNPATEIARLVASLHNQDGSIAVKDYYTQVATLDEQDRVLANQAPYELERYEQTVGIKPIGGESGYSVAERRGFRPTIEINGIHGGYGGEGGKTIIPSSATVKISSRLVKGQDPAWCIDAIIEHLHQRAPQEMQFTVVSRDIGGPAISLSSKTELVAIARQVLDQVSDGKTIFIWEGASIPIVAELAHSVGAEPLLVGFGLEEDCIHAPNESFSLQQFEKGFLYSALLLRALSQ
jgi:acetylornithine deacetylase/succinyl-diaminopimelate desuccinylase-like protein